MLASTLAWLAGLASVWVAVLVAVYALCRAAAIGDVAMLRPWTIAARALARLDVDGVALLVSDPDGRIHTLAEAPCASFDMREQLRDAARRAIAKNGALEQRCFDEDAPLVAVEAVIADGRGAAALAVGCARPRSRLTFAERRALHELTMSAAILLDLAPAGDTRVRSFSGRRGQ